MNSKITKRKKIFFQVLKVKNFFQLASILGYVDYRDSLYQRGDIFTTDLNYFYLTYRKIFYRSKNQFSKIQILEENKMYVQITDKIFTSQGKTFRIYENEEEEKCFELYEILEDLLDYKDRRYVDSKLFPRLESMDMVFNFKDYTYITIEVKRFFKW